MATFRENASQINRRQLVAGGAALAGTTLTFPRITDVAAQDSTPEVTHPRSLPGGYAMVTSLRLPLSGITGADVARIISGEVAWWNDAGAPITIATVPMALDGAIPDGLNPSATHASYDELVAAFDAAPGAFAVVPTDQIDFRVNTLRVDGVDPLHAMGTDEQPIVRVGAAGDIIPGRNVANYIRKYDDFTMPLARVKSVLAQFDFTFANFECFISETLESPELVDANALDFLTRPQFVPSMVDAGIDAVSMANNHAVYSHSGWGLPAFYDTYGYLVNGGVPVFGAGENLDQARLPYIHEVNGMSIAMLGVDGITGNEDYPSALGVVAGAGSQATADHGGTNPLNMANVVADIERLAGEHDIVIPFFHMSEQYFWTPQDWAILTAHQCIDAGASCVISSHPHTIQGMEVYNGKPIFHGIGNFIYDQMFSVDTRQGYLLELTFRGSDVIGFRTHPVEIEAFSQPRFMGQGESAAFMDRFWKSTDLRIRNG